MTDFSLTHLFVAFPTTTTTDEVQFTNGDLRSIPMIGNVIQLTFLLNISSTNPNWGRVPSETATGSGAYFISHPLSPTMGERLA